MSRKSKCMMTHTGEKFDLKVPKEKPSCIHCGKIFRDNYKLNRHILIHTGEKPYPCDQCEKTFQRKDRLKQHMIRDHQMDFGDGQPQNQFLCEQCTKSFTRSDKLKNHLRTQHAGEVNFTCDNCGQEFEEKCQLKTHNKSCGTSSTPKVKEESSRVKEEVAKRRLKKCKLCNEKFSESQLMVQHMKEHQQEQDQKQSQAKLLDDNERSFEKKVGDNKSDSEKNMAKKAAGDVEDAAAMKSSEEKEGCILLHASWEPHLRETWNLATKKNIIEEQFKKMKEEEELNKENDELHKFVCEIEEYSLVEEMWTVGQSLGTEIFSNVGDESKDKSENVDTLAEETLENYGNQVKDKLKHIESMETQSNFNGNFEVELENCNVSLSTENNENTNVEATGNWEEAEHSKEIERNVNTQLAKKGEKVDYLQLTETLETVDDSHNHNQMLEVKDLDGTNQVFSDANNVLGIDEFRNNDNQLMGELENSLETEELKNVGNLSIEKLENDKPMIESEVSHCDVDILGQAYDMDETKVKFSDNSGHETKQFRENIDEEETVMNEELPVVKEASVELSIGRFATYQKEVEKGDTNSFDKAGGEKEISKKGDILDALAELVKPLMEFENESENMDWGQMSEMVVEENMTEVQTTDSGENENKDENFGGHGGVGLTLEEVRMETGKKSSLASASTRSCVSSETLTDPELCDNELRGGVQVKTNLDINPVEHADVVMVDENNSFIPLEDITKQSQEISVREIEQAMGVGPGQAEGCVICKEGGQQFVIINGELAQVLGVENDKGETVAFNDSTSKSEQVTDRNSVEKTSMENPVEKTSVETTLPVVHQSDQPTLDGNKEENCVPVFKTVPASRGKTTKKSRGGRGRRPGRPRGKGRKVRAKDQGFLGPTQGLISRKERDQINKAVIAISEETNNWHKNLDWILNSSPLFEESNSPIADTPDSPPSYDYKLRPEYNDGVWLKSTNGLVTRREREELNKTAFVRNNTNCYLNPRDISPCQGSLKESDYYKKAMEGGLMSAKIYSDWIENNSKKDKNQMKRTNESIKVKAENTSENNSDTDDVDTGRYQSAMDSDSNEVEVESTVDNSPFNNFVDPKGQSTSSYPTEDNQSHSNYFSSEGTVEGNYEKQPDGSSLPSYSNSYNYHGNNYHGYPHYGQGYGSYGYQAHNNNIKTSGAMEEKSLLDLSHHSSQQGNQNQSSTQPYQENTQSSWPLGYESFSSQFGNNASGYQNISDHHNSNENGHQNVNYQNASHQYGEGTNYYQPSYQRSNPVYPNDYFKGFSNSYTSEQYEYQMKQWYSQQYYYNLYHQYYNYPYPSLYSQQGYSSAPSNHIASQENNFSASTHQSPNPEPNPEVTQGITTDETSPENVDEVCEAAKNDELNEILPNRKDEKDEIPWSMEDVLAKRDPINSVEENLGCGEGSPAEFIFVDEAGYPQLYEEENAQVQSPTRDQTKAFGRRKRVSYTKAMLDALTTEYSRSAYLTPAARHRLSTSSGLEEGRIMIWFKNQRMKDKLKYTGERNFVSHVDNEDNIDDYHPEEAGKGGRTRVHYTEAMVDALVKEYNLSMYLTPEARARLCGSLGISEDRILVWFKNRRKKDKLRMEAEGRSDY